MTKNQNKQGRVGHEFCVVITTTDDQKTASNITQKLINDKLAACVQIDQIESFFYFNEKMQKSREYRLMVKALSANYIGIEKSIREIHNYKIPEIIKLDIVNGADDYLAWIKSASI